MNYLLTFSYDGSKFSGFQRQKQVINIQSSIEEALSRILEESVVIKGAGRTDKGVHALNQKANFKTNKNIAGLKKALNNNLKNIKIKKIVRVDDNFHARYSVKNKEYLYKISLNSKNPNYYLNVKYNLNIGKMRKCAALLTGTHNYENFVSGKRLDYETTIINIKIIKIFNTIYIKFKGVGFYRYMIRNLVGAILEVGRGKEDIEAIKMMINLNNSKRLPTVSPNGLYLTKITY